MMKRGWSPKTAREWGRLGHFDSVPPAELPAESRMQSNSPKITGRMLSSQWEEAAS